tara:strand:- start:1393 stop:1992 length:600 start_codon:yes stop_codon:yes gene_type:complete
LITQLTDSALAEKIKVDNDDGEALNELISRHSGIYVDMLKKFGYKSLSQNQISDIMEDKDYVIYKAALEYDPEKAKFSTHLANKTKYLCLTQRTKNKKNHLTSNYDDLDFCQKDKSLNPSEQYIFNDSFSRILKLIEDHEDKRLEVIFNERYFKGKSGKLKPWKEVAKKVGLSAQGCINIHNRALKELKNKIKNEKIKF